MKNITIVLTIILLTGCAHWEAAFKTRDYSCSNTTIKWNSFINQYERVQATDVCFADSIYTMKHSAE